MAKRSLGLTARQENAEGSSGIREIHQGLSRRLSQRADPWGRPLTISMRKSIMIR